MRIFMTKAFHVWARKQKLEDKAILSAIKEIEQGLFDANLGGNVYKKRVSLRNCGKRDGARTIIAFKAHKKVFFIYGFTKNQKENITAKEEKALKELTKFYFGCNENQIDESIDTGELIEVKNEKIYH